MGCVEAPASIGQRLLAMIAHYRGDYGTLSCPLLCRLRGPLEVAALRVALDGLTEAHEALRTTFKGRGRGLTQVIHDPRPLPLDVREADGAAVDAEVAAEVDAELAGPVDVTAWPARATLWRSASDDHTLCLNLHHLVTDAWSTGLLFAELRARYAACLGRGPAMAAPVWQYRDFAAWQRELCEGPGLARHRAYWRERLAGLTLPRLPHAEPSEGADSGVLVRDLPHDQPTEKAGSGVLVRDLPPYIVDGLREIAEHGRTTLFTVTLALYQAVLARLCGQDDLAVASLFANRARPEAADTVGFLANMVVLRTTVPPDAAFLDLVGRTHATVAGALAFQEHPYQTLPLDRASLGRGRVDDVVFQMMAGLDARGEAAGVDFELLVPTGIGSRFGVELAVVAYRRGLRATLFHSPRVAPAVAEALLSGYVAAAVAVARDAGTPVAALGSHHVSAIQG